MKNRLSLYIKNERNRDPGISILTYPYVFAWDQSNDAEVRNKWQQYSDFEQSIVYVHVPFCVRSCRFCGFHKFVGKGYATIQAHLEDMFLEIATAAPLLQGKSPLAMTIGGGTPNILRSRDLARLVRKLNKHFKVRENCETTVEVFPDNSASADKFAVIKEEGVNRISLGFQSLDLKVKRNCNRFDTVEQNIAAFERARDADFDNISVDLICGLPQQTMESWKNSVEKVVNLSPEQICIFPFSIRHPGIPFYNEVKQQLPAFKTLKEMYFRAQETLCAAGYDQATRHNFDKPGRRGLYEYHQSLGTPLLGLGVNSISFLPTYTYKNVKGLEEYASAIRKGQLPIETGFDLAAKGEEANAYLVKRLTFLSIDKMDFRERFRKDFEDCYPEQVDALTSAGLAANDHQFFKLTKTGTYYTALVKRCFFSSYLHKMQAEFRGRPLPHRRKKTTPANSGLLVRSIYR